jgi:hypothetical protein
MDSFSVDVVAKIIAGCHCRIVAHVDGEPGNCDVLIPREQESHLPVPPKAELWMRGAKIRSLSFGPGASGGWEAAFGVPVLKACLEFQTDENRQIGWVELAIIRRSPQ